MSWRLGGTLLILSLVKALVGLRVPDDIERQGLDVTEHGEEGYALDLSSGN